MLEKVRCLTTAELYFLAAAEQHVQIWKDLHMEIFQKRPKKDRNIYNQVLHC